MYFPQARIGFTVSRPYGDRPQRRERESWPRRAGAGKTGRMGETSSNAGYVNSTGEFNRDSRYITTRITADGRDGYPVEPGRYRLVVSRACPWANRAIIVRRLLGLEDVLSLAVAGPRPGERSWTFAPAPGGRDP